MKNDVVVVIDVMGWVKVQFGLWSDNKYFN